MGLETKEEATQAAKALLEQMPKRKGWRIRVWENFGWHYTVNNDYVSVSETMEAGVLRYHAMISDVPNGVGSPAHWCDPVYRTYFDPLTAVRVALRHVEQHRDQTAFVCASVLQAVKGQLG